MSKLLKRFKVPWYEAIYLAIAIATFKHTAAVYSLTLEGPAPTVDWNTTDYFIMGWGVVSWLWWIFWGALMAVAVDVSMFFSSREVRNTNRWYIFAFLFAVSISAFSQLLFAAGHAAPLEVTVQNVPMLAPGGWLRSILEYRVIILPLALPATAALYTFALMLQRRHELVEAQEKTYTAREAAALTGKNYQYILGLAGKGVIGVKNDEKNQWELSLDDLRILGFEDDEES